LACGNPNFRLRQIEYRAPAEGAQPPGARPLAPHRTVGHQPGCVRTYLGAQAAL